MSPPIAGGRGSTGSRTGRFLIAFSFFRVAAIVQGVYKRSLDGNASNPERARAMGAAVPLMAKLAMEEVDFGAPEARRASRKASALRGAASRAKRPETPLARISRVVCGPGEVAEWSIAPHSKCGVRASVPGVRIPPSPPVKYALSAISRVDLTL